ncbi:hypothetical protein E2C01_085087 [Portunus trituberculatus]|uniref:Uncharacterized protein n=1 Tax=Portunus trituberculatus TaxID=210409 RepID=A0A5B7J9I1_PORTR|nr:hypothetical protein [Portunus trituberculatus]
MAVVERLPVPCLKLGEGPHWLPQENCLLFVDVFTKALRKYNVDTKKEEVLYLGKSCGDGEGIVIVLVVAVVVLKVQDLDTFMTWDRNRRNTWLSHCTLSRPCTEIRVLKSVFLAHQPRVTNKNGLL